MIFDREAIFAALFALTSPAFAWKNDQSNARRLKLIQDVPKDQRPAMYQFEGLAEKYTWRLQYAEPIVELEAALYIYIDANDQSQHATTQVNQIMNAVHNAMNPVGADIDKKRNTLGGLVYWARIEGNVFRYPGDIDGDGEVRVPILIRVNT